MSYTVELVGCGSRANIPDTETFSDTATLASNLASKASDLKPCISCRHAPSTDCKWSKPTTVPVAVPDICFEDFNSWEDVDPRNTLGQKRGEKRGRKRTSYNINTTIEVGLIFRIEDGTKSVQCHSLPSKMIGRGVTGEYTTVIRDINSFPYPRETIVWLDGICIPPTPLEL